MPGYFGLTLFFFLSGYLITTLLRIEVDRTGTVSLRQFYLRRLLRIFPPFYLVLAVASALTALGPLGGSLTLRALVAQTCHLTNYYIVRHGWWEGMAPGTWVYWSLAVEEHFYLLFPLAYLWMRRRFPRADRQALILLGFCALVLVWRCILVFGFHAAKDRTYVATDTRMDSIVAGCILAIWRNPQLDCDSISEKTLQFIWIPLGAVAVIASLVIREPRFEQTLRYTLQSLGLTPFFIAAVRWHDRGVFRLLNHRPIRYLGLLSYSLYLMHTSALWGMERWTGDRGPLAVRNGIVFVVLVIVAALIHEYIEKPCARLRRRFSSYLESRAG